MRVKSGYTGHVPRAVEKYGTSHFGGLSPDKPYVPLAQTGHEGYKVSAPGQVPGQAGEKDVELKMIPNYQVPPRCAVLLLPCARSAPPSLRLQPAC